MADMIRRQLLTRSAMTGGVLAGAALLMAVRPAVAASGVDLSFELHAIFFSKEAHQPKPLDPQAFVADPTAEAAVGPQGIHHVAEFHPALVAGPFDVGVFNATGKPLGFTLADWFAAKGNVRFSPAGSSTQIDCHFTNLRANGVYSIFENHFDQQPVGFTPLDGTGQGNNFTADPSGRGQITLQAPRPLTHANAVLLVYHSDNQSHGMSRGEIGVTAHHQLIARVPA